MINSRCPSIKDRFRCYITYWVGFYKSENFIQSPLWHLSTTPAVILKHIVTRENFRLFLLAFWISSLFFSSVWVLSLICVFVFSSFFFFLLFIFLVSMPHKVFPSNILGTLARKTLPSGEKWSYCFSFEDPHSLQHTGNAMIRGKDREREEDEQNVWETRGKKITWGRSGETTLLKKHTERDMREKCISQENVWENLKKRFWENEQETKN